MGAFDIYKRGQGKYTRLGTFAGVVAVGLIGAVMLSQKLQPYTTGTRLEFLRFALPLVLLAGLAWMMFWIVNRPSTVDFMIATESEMKKVSWSSRKEVVGSTKVVIVTTFIMAIILFGVDFLFALIFRGMGILGPAS
jgi:preprotein translocase subunit SecE